MKDKFCRPLIFQTMNSVLSNNLSLKYQRFIPLICNDIRIRKFEFVAKLNSFIVNFSPDKTCI